MCRVARVILVLLAIFLAFTLFPLLINLTSDSSGENAPARQVFSGDQDLADPTVKPTMRPSATVPPRRALELAEAIKEGLVKIEAIGQGLESLELLLDSLSDSDLIVEVKPGTMFKPASASTQTMVVRAAQQVSLDAGGHAETQLDVACANMHLDGQTSADVFNVELDISLSDLIDLLELAEFSQEDFRLQQFLIWTITDNPSRNRYVGLGYFGSGSGPSDEEVDRIDELFLKAGINTGQYNALAHYPTATSVPSRTSEPVRMDGCTPALEVGSSHVGQELCVMGVITGLSRQADATYVNFGREQGAFYMLSYDLGLDEFRPGMCLYAGGKIEALGKGPVMVLRSRNASQPCP